MGYGKGVWDAQGAPRRAFGALCRHDGRMRLPPRFFARIPNNAHYDRHAILVALFCIPGCLLRVVGVMGPNSFEYGTRGDGIGLVRRGARALLDRHDGRIDG